MLAAIDPVRPLLVLGLVTAIASIAGVGGTRPSITIKSENGYRMFGSTFAADGPTIVTADLSRRCEERRRYPCVEVLRIGQLDGDRVVPALRHQLHGLVAIDVRGDTVVVRAQRLDQSGELVIFTRHDGAWRVAPSVELDPECNQGYYQRNVHLGNSMLVVQSTEVWCIYERRGAGWQLGAALPSDALEIGVSGDHLFALRDGGIDRYHRAADGWRHTRFTDSPAGVELSKLALSDRWLVARGDDARLYVYELAPARLAAVLSSQRVDDEFATLFAVGEAEIAATGTIDQRWRFTNGAWRPTGLLEGANDKAPPIFRPVEIADRIWIGNPAWYDGPDGGTIHGFRGAIATPR